MKYIRVLCLEVSLLVSFLLLGNLLPSLDAHPAVAATAGTGYYAVSPFGFTPAYGSSMPSYDIQMIYNPGASPATYFAPVDLPDGVKVTRLVFYYLDNDATLNVSGKLWRSPYINRSQNLMVSFSSGGENPVVRYNEYSTISYDVIDQYLHAYFIEITLPPLHTACPALRFKTGR
jgi:hypothetical protein